MFSPTSQQFLQTFKGAPLSCLIVLLTTPHPMGSTQLVHFTGYSHKSIGEALTLHDESR